MTAIPSDIAEDAHRALKAHHRDERERAAAGLVATCAVPLCLVLAFGARLNLTPDLREEVRVAMLVFAAWFALLASWRFLPRLKEKNPALLVQLTLIALIVYLAHYVSAVFRVQIDEVRAYVYATPAAGEIAVRTEGMTYDMLVSSTYLVITFVGVILLQPKQGRWPLLSAALFAAAAAYAYRLHWDHLAWQGLSVAAIALSTLAVMRKNMRAERETELFLENQRLAVEIASSRLDRELELARGIQTSLTAPRVLAWRPDVKVDCIQIPHAKIGGDWMATRVLDDGRLVAVVADATGKGMQAALVVHAVQSVWALTLDEPEFHVEGFLATANKALVRLGENKLHTMSIGVAVISSEKIEYWSAGHCAVRLVHHEGATSRTETLSAAGDILGLDPELRVRRVEKPLPAGLRVDILLGSDGVFDGVGTRSSAAVAFTEALRAHGARAVEDVRTEDDKTLIWIRAA